MALMYPWATKEYILWEMSLGQLILFYNLGFDIKHGKGENKKQSVRNMSPAKIGKLKKELKDMYGDIE